MAELNPTPPRKSLGHFVKTNAESIDRIARWTPVRSSDTVLDIGCGDGGVLLGLIEMKKCRAIGVEIDERLCDKGRDEALARGYDERTLKFYNKPVEEVPFRAFETVTIVYIYALFVAQNRHVVKLLQKLIAGGVRIVTSTFELPPADFGTFVRVSPDPDTPEGLMELLGPGCTTKLHLYRGDAEGLQGIREVALEMVRYQPNKLKDLPKRLRGDKEIVKRAVNLNGLQLQHALDNLRDDREVVDVATDQSPKAIKYASSRLRGDVQLARRIVKRHGSLLCYFDEHVRGDLECWLSACHCSARAGCFLTERAPRRMRRRECLDFPASPHCQRLRDLRSRAAGKQRLRESMPEVSAGWDFLPDPSMAGGQPPPAKPEEELGQEAAAVPTIEEEPEMEPEEDDAQSRPRSADAEPQPDDAQSQSRDADAEQQPDAHREVPRFPGKDRDQGWFPGEETWVCGSCQYLTGIGFSLSECWHCGGVRGKGFRYRIYAGLDPVTDSQKWTVRGVLRDGVVHMVEGWHVPLALGGEQILRRAPEKDDPADGRDDAGEAIVAWQSISPWHLWHKRKDDALVLWNALQLKWIVSFSRVS